MSIKNTQQQQRSAQTNRWMTTQPVPKEHAEWARTDEVSNVVPSSLTRMKSPQPSQPLISGNSFPTDNNQYTNSSPAAGLRLQIASNTNYNANSKVCKIGIVKMLRFLTS